MDPVSLSLPSRLPSLQLTKHRGAAVLGNTPGSPVMLPEEPSILLTRSSKYKWTPEDRSRHQRGRNPAAVLQHRLHRESREEQRHNPCSSVLSAPHRLGACSFLFPLLWACTCLCGDSAKLGKAASLGEGGELSAWLFFFFIYILFLFFSCPVLAGV